MVGLVSNDTIPLRSGVFRQRVITLNYKAVIKGLSPGLPKMLHELFFPVSFVLSLCDQKKDSPVPRQIKSLDSLHGDAALADACPPLEDKAPVRQEALGSLLLQVASQLVGRSPIHAAGLTIRRTPDGHTSKRLGQDPLIYYRSQHYRWYNVPPTGRFFQSRR